MGSAAPCGTLLVPMYWRRHPSASFFSAIRLLALCALVLLTTPLVAATAIGAGQPLGEALATLRSQGLNILYSTQTITTCGKIGATAFGTRS